MAYVKSNYSTSATSRLVYVMDEPAHDGSNHRNLAITGHNVHLWGLHGQTYNHQSGYFLARQFASIRGKSKAGRMKRHQAQHMIISFADSEFPTDDNDNLIKEANQVNQLVTGFMNEHFDGHVQWVNAVQSDGSGHKLHSHLIINTVNTNGKTIPTNKFNVEVLRNQWNRYLEQHYQQVTGNTYHNPFELATSGANNIQHGWQSDLRDKLMATREQSQSLDDYVETLKKQGITITKRNQVGDWSYHMLINGKKKTIRDFYQRKDKKTGAVKASRGIGKDFTPSSLKQYFEFKLKQQRKAVTLNAKEHSGRTERAVRTDNRVDRSIIDQLDNITRRLNNEQRFNDGFAGSGYHGTDNSGPDASH